MNKITHRQLCEAGAKWLVKVVNWNYRCQKTLVEFNSIANENPDIFGIMGGGKTVCVEVKVSRSDFKADAKKKCRITSKGIGAKRYYMVPENLIKSEEVTNGWGLIYHNEKVFTVIKESEYFEDRDLYSELIIMESVIRRLAGSTKVLDFRKK